MPSRITTLAIFVASAALGSTASGQTYAFSRTELGRIVPARFATTTQQLLSSTDIAVSLPVIAEEAAAVETGNLLDEAMPSDNWGVIALHDAADGESEEASAGESGVFGSSMGRASIAGLAGLAGASYFALRSNDSRAAADQLYYTVGNTLETSLPSSQGAGFAERISPIALVTTAPEPSTYALMMIGMATLGFVARRRRLH